MAPKAGKGKKSAKSKATAPVPAPAAAPSSADAPLAAIADALGAQPTVDKKAEGKKRKATGPEDDAKVDAPAAEGGIKKIKLSFPNAKASSSKVTSEAEAAGPPAEGDVIPRGDDPANEGSGNVVAETSAKGRAGAGSGLQPAKGKGRAKGGAAKGGKQVTKAVTQEDPSVPIAADNTAKSEEMVASSSKPTPKAGGKKTANRVIQSPTSDESPPLETAITETADTVAKSTEDEKKTDPPTDLPKKKSLPGKLNPKTSSSAKTSKPSSAINTPKIGTPKIPKFDKKSTSPLPTAGPTGLTGSTSMPEGIRRAAGIITPGTGNRATPSGAGASVSGSGSAPRAPAARRPVTAAPVTKSLLSSTLAILKGESTPKAENTAPALNREEKPPVQPQPSRTTRNWGENWQMNERQRQQYEASKPQRDAERAVRRGWRSNAVNLQEAKDAYRQDSIQPRSIQLTRPMGVREDDDSMPSSIVKTLLAAT